MYYGAISTDIRKSSTNWNLFPEWMQKAVNYTNNITEFVFNDTNLFNGIILPNSPEGDAYTFYYQHENKDGVTISIYACQNYIYRTQEDCM